MTDSLKLLLPIVTTVLAAILAWFIASQVRKQSTTMDLHKEYSSKDMVASRNGGLSIILQPVKRFNELNASDIVSPSMTHMWQLLYFYHRLAIYVKYRQVRSSLIPSLFGQTFVWWYVNCFESRMSGAQWDISRDLDWLYSWLKASTQREDAKVWNRWYQNAIQDKARYEVAVTVVT